MSRAFNTKASRECRNKIDNCHDAKQKKKRRQVLKRRKMFLPMEIMKLIVMIASAQNMNLPQALLIQSRLQCKDIKHQKCKKEPIRARTHCKSTDAQ